MKLIKITSNSGHISNKHLKVYTYSLTHYYNLSINIRFWGKDRNFLMSEKTEKVLKNFIYNGMQKRILEHFNNSDTMILNYLELKNGLLSLHLALKD